MDSSLILNIAFLNKGFAVFLNFPVLISLTIFKTQNTTFITAFFRVSCKLDSSPSIRVTSKLGLYKEILTRGDIHVVVSKEILYNLSVMSS
jgi:hypothetical protein